MKVLKTGSSGVPVEHLSLGLIRAGFNPGGIKDTYDQQVKNAVIAFQNKEGITADGIAGEETYQRLLPYLKGYDTQVIDEGQSLADIAKSYLVNENAIRIANPMVQSFLPGTQITVPYGFDVVPSNVNYTYELVLLIMEGLKARYPFVDLSTAGNSVMDKELWYIKIGTGEKKIFFNGSHHANEWITTPVLLTFAEEYLKAIATGGAINSADASTLYSTKSLYIMPLVNPDGVDLVNGAIDPSNPLYINARSISMNYPSISFPGGWKANIAGTDLNLNYPASWEKAKEIKYSLGFVSPAPRDFVGASPLSAIESRAVYNFSIKNNFALTVSMHTQGEVIYWKYLDYLPPRSEEIALELSRVSGYTLETTPYASSFAGYKDWFISYYNLPGYTVETGKGQNPLPISELKNIYPANSRLLTKALELG